MDGDGTEHGLDEREASDAVHEPSLPSGEPAGHALDERLQLRAGEAPDRERNAQVGHGQADNWAAEAFRHRRGIVRRAVQQGGGALGVVHMQAGGVAKELQDGLHRRDVALGGVAEEYHIVGVERDFRDMAPQMELLENAQGGRAPDEAPQDVNREDK